MSIAIIILKFILRIIYGILKIFPIKSNKVLFLSRQSSELSLDFTLLKKELECCDPNIEIVAICHRMAGGKDGILGFAIATLKSMYHLSTSSVCVLDAYWPVVSILNHKKGLTVIQMWHAIGKIKQSGYQTLDKESGRSGKLSRLLCMHENYDIIIAGGEAWNQFYCKSFNTTCDKLINIGLPRIDHLLEKEEYNRGEIFESYPKLKGKIVLLYAPTFRRGIELNWEPLVENIDFTRFALIIKGHPNQSIYCEKEGVLTCPEFKAVDLLSACDYLITDYSAIAIEAAVLNKPTLYFVYDYEQYTEKNGLNINLYEEMPGCVFSTSKELIKVIENNQYNYKAFEKYREKYLPKNLGTSTKSLAKVVLKNLDRQ